MAWKRSTLSLSLSIYLSRVSTCYVTTKHCGRRALWPRFPTWFVIEFQLCRGGPSAKSRTGKRYLPESRAINGRECSMDAKSDERERERAGVFWLSIASSRNWPGLLKLSGNRFQLPSVLPRENLIARDLHLNCNYYANSVNIRCVGVKVSSWNSIFQATSSRKYVEFA